jgi:hypothetical protein
MIPIGGDTLFTFNYRSDRVREIVSVLGLPDKPMEVTVPDNLASRSVPQRRSQSNKASFAAHHHHDPVQRRVPLLDRFPSYQYDQRLG